MARKEFELVSSYAPLERMKIIDLSSSEPVAPGSGQIIQAYSAPNTISQVVRLYFQTPVVPGATTGEQLAYIFHQEGAGASIRGVGSFNKSMEYNYGRLNNTNEANQQPELPEDKLAQFMALENLYFDENIPISFQYRNLTDVANTAKRTVLLTVIEREIRVSE